MFDFVDGGLILADIYVNGVKTFDSSTIVDGGLSVNRYSTSAIAIEYGNVSAGELSFAVDLDIAETTVSLGDTVKARLYLESDPNVYIETGDFIVTGVSKERGRANVVCLDKMIMLDIKADLSGLTFPMTATQFLTTVYGGLGHNVTVTNNVYGSLQIDDPVFEEGVTYRQVLSKLCESIGANAYYKDGIVVDFYHDINTEITDSTYIEAELTEESYSVVSVEITQELTGSTVEIDGTDITLRILNNPFLANKTEAQRTQIATVLLNKISSFSFYGAKFFTLPMPELLPMDVVTIDGKKVPITSATYGMNSNSVFEAKITSENDSYNYAFQRDIEKIKQEVKEVKENDKHFFYRDDSGVHITMVENDYTTGRNVLVDSNSFQVMNGTTVLSSFGENIRLGQITQSNVLIEPSSITMTDASNSESLKLYSGAGNLPVGSEASTTLVNLPYTKTFTISNDIDWNNPLTVFLRASRNDVFYPEPVSGSISFTSPSSAPGVTLDYLTLSGSISGNTLTITVGGTATDIFVSLAIGYFKPLSRSIVRVRSNAPEILFMNTLGGASSYIRAYSGGGYGNNFVFNPGGNFIAGGGEYAENRYRAGLGGNTAENTYIGADGTVYIETNGQSIASRKTWVFDSDGDITTPPGGLINGVNISKSVTFDTPFQLAEIYSDSNVAPHNILVRTYGGGVDTSASIGTKGISYECGAYQWSSILASGIQRINFGDGTNTAQTWMWGNATNKVGIGAYNTGDEKRYNILARASSLILGNQTDGTNEWAITGLSGTINLGAIGTVSEVSPNAVSVASGSVKNVTSRSLVAGTWLVIGSAQFASNATGRRAIQLSTTNTGDALSRTARDVQSPVSGAVTLCNFTTIVQPTATTTYYLNAYQNSGSALSTEAQLQCIRIK